MNDPRKQSIYMEVAIVRELRSEAARQQRTLSWLMQRAWALAREDIKKLRTPDVTPLPRDG